MPIEVEYIEAEHTVIMKMVGLLTAEEITATIVEQLDKRMIENPDKVIHAIYDVTEFEWTFQEFINYIKQIPPSSENQVRAEYHEHFVGRSQWVNQLRTWWKKNIGKETTAFQSIEDARDYIRDLRAAS